MIKLFGCRTLYVRFHFMYLYKNYSGTNVTNNTWACYMYTVSRLGKLSAFSVIFRLHSVQLLMAVYSSNEPPVCTEVYGRKYGRF